MKLRSGKEYSFKKPKLLSNKKKKEEKTVPKCVKAIVDYIKRDFARAGLKVTLEDYCFI